MHNYAIQFLGLKKYSAKAQFWSSAPPLGPIKAKFIEYLQGIEYRLRILSETPRENFANTIVKVTVQGLFVEYETKKTIQAQTRHAKVIELAMDKELCRLYGESSREFEKNIEVSTKSNIELLCTLAVMELQFMHGCGVGWKQSGVHGGTAAGAGSPQVLTSGSHDDASDGDGVNAGAGGGVGARATETDADENEPEELVFSGIDCEHLLDNTVWATLKYDDAAEFVSHRESLAMAILFFLSEELGDKFPKLKGQVHAGWLAAFKTPINMDQLLDPPSAIDFNFSDDEDDWIHCTMQHLVDALSEEQREGLGITAAHLARLSIPPTNVSPNQTLSKPFPLLQLCVADVSSLPQRKAIAQRAPQRARAAQAPASADEGPSSRSRRPAATPPGPRAPASAAKKVPPSLVVESSPPPPPPPPPRALRLLRAANNCAHQSQVPVTPKPDRPPQNSRGSHNSRCVLCYFSCIFLDPTTALHRCL